MKKYFNRTLPKIGLISLIIFIIISLNNNYMTFKDRECIVIDKIQLNGSYKHSGNFYLILKEKKTGIVFDKIVSASTYVMSNKNDIKIFNLRNMDIKQTFKENLIYFFGETIFLAMSITFLLFGLIDFKELL